jgi:degV domain-containing protein BH3627
VSKIVIVTDSTADIPSEIADRLGIVVVPLTVHFEDKSYLDRIDISNQEFYEYLKTCKTLPTTSQISPGVFLETYQKLAEEGFEEIISVHLAKTLSGTVDSARIASQMIADKVKVTVVDSLTATMGLGNFVHYLAKLINEKAPMAKVQQAIVEIPKKTSLYFLLDSLDNLEKGGRIGKASYLVGSILNIKPILRLEEGVIEGYDRVRGSKENKALIRLADIVAQKIDPSKKLYASFGYNDRRESSEQLKTLLQERGIETDEASWQEIGSVVSCHIGLGAVGIAFFQLDEEG